MVTIVGTFFVISGFLITTLLLQESRSTGSISLRKFFSRRAIRLLPTVWLFVSVWLVIGAIGQAVGIKGLTFVEVLKDGAAAVTYVYHVFFPNGLYMIHPGQQDKRTMWHLWTLSVEEHFYLVIPGLVLWCIRRNWIKALGWGMGVGAFAIGVARLLAYTGPAMSAGTPSGIRLAFLQRPDALMLGVASRSSTPTSPRRRWPATAARSSPPAGSGSPCGSPLSTCRTASSNDLRAVLRVPAEHPAQATHEAMTHHWYWYRFGHSLGAIGFALLMFSLYRFPGNWLDRLLSWEPFRWVGRLSYTLYVWHALPYVVILALTNGDDATPTMKLLRTPVLMLAAFAVSMPVYYKVELKVMAMKLRFASEKETLDLRTGKMVETPGSGSPTRDGAGDGDGGGRGADRT